MLYPYTICLLSVLPAVSSQVPFELLSDSTWTCAARIHAYHERIHCLVLLKDRVVHLGQRPAHLPPLSGGHEPHLHRVPCHQVHPQRRQALGPTEATVAALAHRGQAEPHRTTTWPRAQRLRWRGHGGIALGAALGHTSTLDRLRRRCIQESATGAGVLAALLRAAAGSGAAKWQVRLGLGAWRETGCWSSHTAVRYAESRD